MPGLVGKPDEAADHTIRYLETTADLSSPSPSLGSGEGFSR
jgi:hypothetical protein